MPRRGYIHWARLDKRRPVLVVSIDARNERANDVIAVPCSTTMRDSPTHVRLRRGEGGVPDPCVLKCEQLATLSKADIEMSALGGPLSPRLLAEVERGILRAIGVPV